MRSARALVVGAAIAVGVGVAAPDAGAGTAVGGAGGGLLGQVAPADLVDAASSQARADAIGDVGAPPGDVIAVADSYNDGIVALVVATAAQTDPTRPEWRADGTFLRWDLYVDQQPDVDARAWLYATSAGDVRSEVRDADGDVVCDAVPAWGALEGTGGYLGVGFLGSCIGNPATLAWQAVLAYEEGGRTMVDRAPDDEALFATDTPAPAPVQPAAAQLPAPPTSERTPVVTPGYWMAGADGSVWGFGPAAPVTAPGTAPAPGQRTTAITSTASGAGYWVLDSDGTLHASGDAAPHEGAAMAPGEQAVSLSATPSGDGLWIFTDRGRAIARGAAGSFGDLSAVRLNGPILGSVATPTGQGYYLVASDGGVFTFGDATFAGSMGDQHLNAPVEGLVPDPDGSGYWLVASDGGVFAFDAGFRGSLGDVALNRPIVGMVAHAGGYLMVGADGGIFNFSDAAFHGSLGASPPAVPVVAVASQARVPTAGVAAAAGGWYRLNRNGNGWYDGWALDANGDGVWEAAYFDDGEDGYHEVIAWDSTGDQRWDRAWADAGQDGYYEVVVDYVRSGYGGAYETLVFNLDTNGDRRTDVAYYDGDRNGIFEWVKWDTNGDGYADTWYANTAPAGRTAADAAARNIAAVSSVNILATAGIPVFFPSATIPL
jgi:hypothetical protein